LNLPVTSLSVARRPRQMHLAPEPTDAGLLAATAADPAAFGGFYRRYERRVLTYMRQRIRDPELVADLTAEVFARVLESASDFDAAKSSDDAGGWLLTIAHNTLVTSVRRGKVADAARHRIGMLTPLVLDEDAFERIEALDSLGGEVITLLNGLPETQRTAIAAHVLDERPYEDIAAEMRCSPLVVRKRVSRGLATLRARMEEST
jgi:RNA polymerase sigma factor (sigma-70 family)